MLIYSYLQQYNDITELQHITLALRAFFSFELLSILASPDVTDALLKKVGSEYLFKHDPGPPGSNLRQ